MDLGLDVSDVDPIWRDGVMAVRSGFHMEQERKMGQVGG